MENITGTNTDNDTAAILIDNSSTKNVSEFPIQPIQQ